MLTAPDPDHRLPWPACRWSTTRSTSTASAPSCPPRWSTRSRSCAPARTPGTASAGSACCARARRRSRRSPRSSSLHSLAVEDTIKAHQRPKLERYGDVQFVVLRPARYVDPVEVIEIGEVHLFLGPDFVITVRHAEEPDLGAVRHRLEERARAAATTARTPCSTRSWTRSSTTTARCSTACRTTSTRSRCRSSTASPGCPSGSTSSAAR